MSGVEGAFDGEIGGFRLAAEFRLEPTGVTALSGPSGAGKSTLLRCIAGLTRLPGRLVVGDDIWQDSGRFLAPHRRAVGVVFQDAGLLSHLSVHGNLVYGARGSGHEGGVDDVVELLGLRPLMGRGVDALSGGERQRVALGRALLTRPRLLLMDEPLSSLDLGAKAEILPYLDRLLRTLAIPALYISHDQAEIARLADRVLMMRDGRIEGPAVEAHRAHPTLDGLTPAERDGLAIAALRAGLGPLPASEA